MLRDCPYSWDNLSKDAVATYSEPNSGIGNPGNYGCFFTSDDVTFGVLYTRNLNEENCLLLKETRNRALDAQQLCVAWPGQNV